jgi:glycosyltransferase involved in cell wall biosynthesis
VPPIVSIIIPTYNRAHLIGETLDSVLSQTFKNWECIIVDDVSSDGTSELLQKYCNADNRFKYIRRPENKKKGANSCRNEGFRVSKGVYIQWFDDDDVMLPEFLDLKINSFNSNTEMVICKGFYTDSNLNKFDVTKMDGESNLFEGIIFWTNQIITQSILFKKSFLINKTLFLEELAKSQEFELFSRLFFNIKREEYVIIDEALFLYRQHATSKTTLGKNYNYSFKRSEAYIDLNNLERSIEIKNVSLVKFIYFRLIDVLEESIAFKDKENKDFIIKGISRLLFDLDKTIYFKFNLFASLMVAFPGRGSLRHRLNMLVGAINRDIKISN